MKKILLVIAIFAIARVNAQIVNAGFESWDSVTNVFPGYTGIVPASTFNTLEATGWTSGNGITGASGLGSHILVTQSTTPYAGHYAVQLTTDTLATIAIPVIGNRQLTVPGLILNGTFPVGSITQSILNGGVISPAIIPGAGQPCTTRLQTFSGYYQYTPVYDTFTHAMDTCIMWATLKNGVTGTIVANAEFRSQTNTGGEWSAFSAPFVYLSCEQPDTLIIMLASSVPVFSGIINGTTDLVPGSVLLVDSLSSDTLAAGFGIVLAANDVSTAVDQKPDTIPVLANDCSVLPVSVSILTAPVHGTATISSADSVIYTANAGFSGVDSLQYIDMDVNHTSATAWVHITVSFGAGISEANQVAVKMFPVPASNQLNIQFDNNGKTTANIYDVVGNLIKVVTLTQNDNTINIANLTNGIYSLQLVDQSNSIIARGKFVVSK